MVNFKWKTTLRYKQIRNVKPGIFYNMKDDLWLVRIVLDTGKKSQRQAT